MRGSEQPLRESDHGDDHDKAGQVYAKIREVLLFRRISPGTFLNIRNLAKRMNVSPTPVREALIRLADEDVITLTPGRGFFSRALDVEDLAAEYEMAFVIAKFSIEKNVATFSLAGVRRPPHFSEEPENLVVTEDITRSYTIFLETCLERVAGMSANIKLIRAMQQFIDRTSYIREIDLQHPPRLREIARQMCELVETMEKGDIERAVQNLERQIQRKMSLLRELVKEANLRSMNAAVSIEQLL
jgi:DNA-binding GntR family transcriptional regulator